MIITRLTLHNVGAYRGAHSIELAPVPGKPVTLVGAINVSGKTTLLEAIQLALYGRSARHLIRDASGYADYLKSLINRHVNPRDGAAVTLEFTHRSGGKSTQYAVSRTWSAAGNGIREDLQVKRDGLEDPAVSERWVEFVNGLLPVQIADLFLFDGERIEALAKPESSAEVLRTGIHALLGLDLVDNLSRSLALLERRLQKDSSALESQGELTRLEKTIDHQERRRQELVSQEASLQNELDATDKALARAQERLRAEGGDLAVAREVIEYQVKERRLELDSVEGELRSLAGEGVPLLLVRPLVEEAAGILAGTAANAVDEVIRQRLEEKRDSLRDELKLAGLKRSAAESFLSFLTSQLSGSEPDSGEDVWQQLAGSSADRVVLDDSPVLTESVKEVLARWELAMEQVALAEAKEAAVPAAETIRHLVLDEAQAVARRASAQQKRESVTVDREVIDRQLARDREAMDVILKQRRETDRMSLHSARAREVLASFRIAVAARKLQSLEVLIARNFKALLRKSDLVGQVSIDPTTFALTVRGEDGIPVPTDRLSAGERQLLAVAALWSLAQASGRELPVVIDTPLGRLDSIHRGLLVDNYFPRASHQVILLSTDEEVRGEYYERLQPFIGRQHLITYREKDKTSQFEEGYFSVGVAA
jgi:DNA sulfur modification protein DndD